MSGIEVSITKKAKMNQIKIHVQKLSVSFAKNVFLPCFM